MRGSRTPSRSGENKSESLPTLRPCGVAVALAIAISAPAAHAQSTRSKGVIEEVVVTATKREKSMQNVPVAMSTLEGKDLQDLRIGSFDDYIQYLPNVVSQGTGPGQNEIFIRGAATSQSIITLSSVQGLQPSVALFLDEQPVAMQGRNLDVYAADLKRVEVLPGPQGTLFGASSQAGTAARS
jgi:iron complex outermembrane recepter protein